MCGSDPLYRASIAGILEPTSQEPLVLKTWLNPDPASTPKGPGISMTKEIELQFNQTL